MAEEASPVIAKNEKLLSPVGTYLEQITEGEEELGKHGIVTLGNLINEAANRQENLYIPMISEKNERPVISQYYVLSSFSSIGTVDEDTFHKAMLLENKMKKYQLQLDTGESVELSDIHVSSQMADKKEKCLEKIQIKANARLQNETMTDSQKQQEMKQKIQEYLKLEIEAVANSKLGSQKLDISNSFYRLGGYNRTLYKEYHENQRGYLKNLNYEINCSIQLIDE